METEERNRKRLKDAELAHLMGLPVKCLPGYWDPEAGYFIPHIPSCDDDKFIVIEKREEFEKAYAAWKKRRERRRVERRKDLPAKDQVDLEGETFWQEYVNTKEVDWHPETKYDGIHDGVEFCTGYDPKHWTWKEIPHYSNNLNAAADVEEYIGKLGDKALDHYIAELSHITREVPARAAIKATAEQKVDAAIQVLKHISGGKMTTHLKQIEYKTHSSDEEQLSERCKISFTLEPGFDGPDEMPALVEVIYEKWFSEKSRGQETAILSIAIEGDEIYNSVMNKKPIREILTKKIKAWGFEPHAVDAIFHHLSDFSIYVEE